MIGRSCETKGLIPGNLKTTRVGWFFSVGCCWVMNHEGACLIEFFGF